MQESQAFRVVDASSRARGAGFSSDEGAPYQSVLEPTSDERWLIHRCLERQVSRTPHQIAVVSEGRKFTYEELNAHANRLAVHLIAKGVGPDDLVAVCVERSLEMVVALLGILKSGGAYVPLDPAYPGDRLEYILRDANPKVLLVEDHLRDRIPEGLADIVVIDKEWSALSTESTANPELPVAHLSARNLAYVIYTSGSTGTPKGVMVEHRNVLRLFRETERWFGFSDRDVWTLFHSFAFDFSVWELWGALLYGGRVVVVPYLISRSPNLFYKMVCEEGVTVLNQTPSAFSQFIDAQSQSEERHSLRFVIFGGESLDFRSLRPWLQRNRLGAPHLINMYGITETTVHVTYRQLSERDIRSEPGSLVGCPLPDLEVRLLDSQMQPVPAGSEGEIYVGGAGVARGYLNRPALTAERFLAGACGIEPGSRLYKAGDLARQRPDGTLEYLGRNDQQVKIRGFRIELGEIEAHLVGHPDVREAAVLAREDVPGNRQLVGYVTVDLRKLKSRHREDTAQKSTEIVGQWKSLYETTYSQGDLAPSFIGWNSSYTGKPIPEEQMQEWRDETVSRILSTGPRRVLEIGCGVGLLLEKIAPHCEKYRATDFSSTAVERLRQWVGSRPDLRSVELQQCSALEIQAEPFSYDTVILNSVVQYFPDLDYLHTVLQRAARWVRPGGLIFVGDVRHFGLLKVFHYSIQLEKALPETDMATLRARVARSLDLEEELTVDPQYFLELQKQLPGVSSVQMLPKQGVSDNELTRYRYDAMIQVGQRPISEVITEQIEWRGLQESLAEIIARLQQSRPTVLRVRNVPNGRLQRDLQACQLIEEGSTSQTVGELKAALAEAEFRGGFPAQFWGVAEEAEADHGLGYDVSVTLVPGRDDGAYDVEYRDRACPVFYNSEKGANHLDRGSAAEVSPPAFQVYANDPLGRTLKRGLVLELRTQLKGKLPQHMLPSAVVVLERFPLTQNGKLDRKALPAPDLNAYATRNYEAPQGDVEETLSDVWQELLRLERVGRNDNFFELGGNSLLIVQMMERLGRLGWSAEVRSIFESPTLAAMAGLLRRQDKVHVPPNLIPFPCEKITPAMLSLVTLSEDDIDGIARAVPGGHRNIQDIYPLASLQEGMLFHHLLDENASDAYVLVLLFSVSSPVRLQQFINGLQAVVDRHDILRTAVLWENLPHPVQVVCRHSAVPVERMVLNDGEDSLGQIREYMDPDRQKLDLTKAPLLRLIVADDPEKKRCYALLKIHHLVHDHNSLDTMLEEVMLHVKGRESELPKAIPFREHVARVLDSKTTQDAESFFRAKLGDVTESTIPLGLTDVHGDGSRIEESRLVLEAALSMRIREQARRLSVSPATLFHAAWGLVVARLSGREDVVFGTVLLGRLRSVVSEARMLGMFINTLPMRLRLRSLTAGQLVEQTRVELAGLLDHEQASLAIAQQCSGLDRSAPLFTSLLNYLHGAPTPEIARSHRAFGVEPIEFREWTNYPLAMSVADIDGGFVLTAQTDRRVESHRITKYLDVALRSLLQALERAPMTPALELEVLPGSERDRVVGQFNATASLYPRDRLVHELFENFAEETPLAISLAAEGQDLTYEELNNRANRLARFLRHSGLTLGEPVPILMSRSIEMIVAELAVLKCGCAYVPVDPSLPIERQSFMIQDCGARRAIIGKHVHPVIEVAPDWIAFEEAERRAQQFSRNNFALDVPSSLPAYIMYTSGSTGIPKGVVVSHQAINRLVINSGFIDVGPEDVVLHTSNPAFDASTLEVWAALLSGARLVIVPQTVLLEMSLFGEFLLRENVTVVFLTTGLFSQYSTVLPNALPEVKLLMTGGDVLDPTIARRVLENGLPGRLLNLYGPTEGTTVSTAYRVGPQEHETVVPIGSPIANTQIYILGPMLQPVPVGVSGEIYIGGEGCALGYLNRPALTAEKFVADPFSSKPGGRLYRTGDLGLWRQDGNIEFLGRNDLQVKLRGFRIELGEIETQLMQHSGVKQAVVIARQESVSGAKRLVAYVTLETQENSSTPGIEGVRERLRKALPEYMIPSAFVVLEEMPLTPNGKIDRRALPAFEVSSDALREYEPPRGESEEILVRLWQQILGIERVGRRDNFFELGGHSLLIVQMLEGLRRIGLSIGVRRVYEHQTLADLAAVLGSETSEHSEPSVATIPEGTDRITPEMLPLVQLDARHIEEIVRTVPGGALNIQDIYPLLPLQEGMLFHNLYDQIDGDTYVRAMLLSFDSRDNLDKFVVAFQKVIDRHDSLRTAVLWEHLPQPVQVVYRHATLPILELPRRADIDPLDALQELMRPELQRLPLDRAPLMRLQIAGGPRIGRWYLLLQSHHIVDDAASLNIALSEVLAILQGRAEDLTEPKSYRRHVSQVLARTRTRDDEEFFRSKLADIEQPTVLFDRQSAPGGGSQTDEARAPLERDLTARVRSLVRRLNVSTASLFHAAWALVVARTSGRDDVVYGTVLSGRLQGGAGSHGILGMFINTLPLRLELRGITAGRLLKNTHRELIELVDHEQCSLAAAQRCSGVDRTKPLFNSLLNYRHNVQDLESRLGEASGMSILATQGGRSYPITMSIDDLGEDLLLVSETDCRVAASSVIRYLEVALRSLVESLEGSAQNDALSLSVLPDEEIYQVTRSFNATHAAYPTDKLIHLLFDEQVERTPTAIAVVYEGQSLTYAELNAKATRLANFLRLRGVGPDQLVGVCVERGAEMVVGLLGILKAGGAYVPLDPGYPPARLAYMLDDARPRVLLTQERLLGVVPESGAEVVALDRDWPEICLASEKNSGSSAPGAHSGQLAYVIYTSGSTGTPKGVMIDHRSVINLWNGLMGTYREPACTRIALNASINFDASVQQVARLLSGDTLFLLEQEVRRDASSLLNFISERGVESIDCTPSQLRTWVEAGLLERSKGPRAILVGGEGIDRKLWRLLAGSEAIQFYNVYGPTECTVDSTIWRLNGDIQDPHIGRPMPNRRVYILDGRCSPVPVGVAGEIHIGGEGVSRGYLNRTYLTAERFVADPFGESGSRMYRTGDLGRWREDGTIEYLGRNDHQVKVRGFRIELGEIEALLLKQPQVREAVVLAREDVPGDLRLVAYVVAEVGTAIDNTEALRNALKKALPEYMVPGAFVLLERLPLTPSGKLDRRALPVPDIRSSAGEEYIPLQSELEEQVAAIWREVLPVDRIGRLDNFFELGGHSLLATRVTSRIREQLKVELSVRSLFDAPTVMQLSKLVESTGRTREASWFDDLSKDLRAEIEDMESEDMQAEIARLREELGR